MNNKLLDYMKHKPKLYEESSSAFWDDENISKYMLEAHINPEWDAASRKYDFIKKSVDWINEYCGGGKDKYLLDLGCGPGIYAELFYDKGFSVTGIDFSKRSIEYAKDSASKNKKDIKYYYKNYLDIDYEDEYDVITLIYCDFGVLSHEDREILLKKIWKALKKDGILILDAWNESYLKTYKESESVQYQDKGFWSSMPYVVIEKNSIYKESRNTLEQYIVITEEECNCYNIWNQIYDEKTLSNEIKNVGFNQLELFDDVAGKKFTGQEDTLCVIAKK